jgi:hypothetical protein
MEYPHFYYQSAINHKDTVSEDIYFCKKARDNGFKVWVDTTITCDHKGSTFFKVKSEVKPIEIPKQVEVKKDETGVTVIPDSYRKERIFK